MKKNNIIQEATWHNPYIAIDTKNNGYELDNIIIYSEHGVLLETDLGWFGYNNNLGDQYIGDINKRMKIDFSKKENFIIKSQKKDYKFEAKHTLYIYYKNINCEFLGYSIDLFLKTNFTILDGYKIDNVIGFTDRKTKKIEYSEELKDAFGKIDSYNFTSHYEKVEKAIKTIKKAHKQLEEAKEIEKNYTLKDWREMMDPSAGRVDPYYIINTIKQTYNADIDEMEAIR